jgi:WD40 repeat protein
MYPSAYTAIKISKDGKYIASAETSLPGQIAEIIVWDFQQKTVKQNFKLHKNSVTSLTFSPDSQLLVSQGSLEDKY